MVFRGTEFLQQPHVSGGKSFSNWASDKTAAPADILISALWNPEAEDLAKLCPDSWFTETAKEKLCAI